MYAGAWQLKRKLGLGPEIRRYASTIDTLRAAHQSVDGTVHSAVVTGWDNTPRSGKRGLVRPGNHRENFERAIRAALELEEKNAAQLLFIKSWNEWAEGNTIEPKFKESWSAGDVLANSLSSRS